MYKLKEKYYKFMLSCSAIASVIVYLEVKYVQLNVFIIYTDII